MEEWLPVSEFKSKFLDPVKHEKSSPAIKKLIVNRHKASKNATRMHARRHQEAEGGATLKVLPFSTILQ